MSVITTTDEFPKLRHFIFDEFRCSHTGEVAVEEMFLYRLDELRARCGFPFTLTSAYRSPLHPIERVKERPGMHSHGIAVDVAVTDSEKRWYIIKNAFNLYFCGVGIYEKHVHIDDRGHYDGFSNVVPVLWHG